MKNFLLAFILGTLPFLATGKPIPAITDSLGNRIYNLNAITIISNPKWDSKLFEFPGSISYLNTGNLDEMNIRSVKDISTVVPNLFIPDYGSTTFPIWIKALSISTSSILQVSKS